MCLQNYIKFQRRVGLILKFKVIYAILENNTTIFYDIVVFILR